MKTCNTCKHTLPRTDFGPRRGVAGGNGKCKKCCNEYTKSYFKNNPEYKLKHNRLIRAKRYGITVEEVIKFEDGCCEICGGPGTHIDHCHSTGKVRGLLCSNCNYGLGHFRDNEESLESAINYLRQNKDV